MADLYRPSSGTEGADFMNKWCAKCKCDQDYRDNEGDSCIIAANSFTRMVDEWIYERDEPVCTAFEPVDPLVMPYIQTAAVRDMFPGPRSMTIGEQIKALVGEVQGNG